MTLEHYIHNIKELMNSKSTIFIYTRIFEWFHNRFGIVIKMRVQRAQFIVIIYCKK